MLPWLPRDEKFKINKQKYNRDLKKEAFPPKNKKKIGLI